MAARKSVVPPTAPQPVKVDSRISFGIAYYATEADAEMVGREIERRGETRNGGYFHGMPLGRDKGWDYVDPDLGPLFAVTRR